MKLSLDTLREWLNQIEVVKGYYSRLTERERYIVLASVGGGILFLMITTYSILAATTASLASKIEGSRENLKRLQEFQEMYQQTEQQVRELDNLIQRTPPDFQLATRLEGLAGKNSVKIDSIREHPATPNELYRETQVEVTVRQISLRTLIQFLFDIENSPEMMRVSSLKVKPNFQDPTQLNVIFMVSTFQAAQGS